MVCAFVSAAVADDEFQTEFTETYRVPETEAVVSWEGVTKARKIRGAHGYDDTEDLKVLHRIKSLIAFALAAKEKVSGNMPRSSSRPLFDMMKMLGKENYKKKNPVLAFATVMGALLSKYRMGMGKYLLSRVNAAVLKRGGLFHQFKNSDKKSFVTFSHRKLGLQYKPKYFKHFTVTYSDFTRRRINLNMHGASGAAAASFLRKETQGMFQRFLDQQTAYWGRKHSNHIQANAAKAFGAQMKAYRLAKKRGAKRNGLIVPQTPAGVKASKEHHRRSGFHMPSMKQMRIYAKRKLDSYMKKQKKKHGAFWLVKAIEASLRGVTIRVSTMRKFGAASGNTPTVVFKGSKRKLTVKIDGCPPEGKTRTMHFPSKHDLGDLVDVSIKGGNDLWNVNTMDVQMTAVGKWHTLSKKNFWVGKKAVRACVGKCVVWKTHKPTAKCSAACGVKAHVLHGSVSCNEEKGGKKVSNLKCVHQQRSKPARPTKGCAANAPCVRFITHAAAGCSSKCGQRAHYKYGKVQCQEVVSKKIVAHSKCHFWGLKTPATPRRHCAATKSCINYHARANSFKCYTTTRRSNNAGVVQPNTWGTMVGGGMLNHYRSWNSKAGFEQMNPSGNNYQCDMAFGSGQVTCYTRGCAMTGGLQCKTWSARMHMKSGIKRVSVGAGYTLTGGGIYNHYRHWNKASGFEESYPEGNAWRGDMGFGAGDFTVYARGCKAPAGNKLECVTARSASNINHGYATCPRGYWLTGCGIVNQYRHWNKLAGFEATHPDGNNQRCVCDSGFGSGKETCYARCCRVR